jgi:hypothetical protein
MDFVKYAISLTNLFLLYLNPQKSPTAILFVSMSVYHRGGQGALSYMHRRLISDNSKEFIDSVISKFAENPRRIQLLFKE